MPRDDPSGAIAPDVPRGDTKQIGKCASVSGSDRDAFFFRPIECGIEVQAANRKALCIAPASWSFLVWLPPFNFGGLHRRKRIQEYDPICYLAVIVSLSLNDQLSWRLQPVGIRLQEDPCGQLDLFSVSASCELEHLASRFHFKR
jgi:hypothetical protein